MMLDRLRSLLGCVALACVLLPACSEDVELRNPAASDTRACSSDATVTREELENGAPAMCEHQTLMAPIFAKGSAFSFPLRIVADEPIELCMKDDDGEPHSARFTNVANETVAEVVADAGCVTKHLTPGVYNVELRHGAPGTSDLEPDVIHTRLTRGTGGRPTRLLLTTNECQSCDLSNKPWPYLSDESAGFISSDMYGYTGDYRNANFTGSTCKPTSRDRAHACVLGRDRGNFDGAVFDDVVFGSYPVTFVMLGMNGNDLTVLTSFVGASFKRMKAVSTFQLPYRVQVRGNFRNARFDDASFGSSGAAGGTFFGDFRGADFTRAKGTQVAIEGVNLGFLAYRTLQPSGMRVRNNTVYVETTDDLTNAIIKGENDKFVWPSVNGVPAMHGMSFAGSTLSNIVFPCPALGDLSNVTFTGTTLQNVSFSGCSLRGATFAGATLNGVTAMRTSFDDAVMTGLTIRGFDMSNSVLSAAPSTTDTRLSLAANTTAVGFKAIHSTIAVRAPGFTATQANLAFANLSSSSWTNAHLELADLSSTTLTQTDFSGAVLDGASFVDSTGTAVIFTNASLKATKDATGKDVKTNLDRVQWKNAKLDAADFNGATMTSAIICGGTALGAKLNATDLRNALFPDSDNVFTIGGKTFTCQEVGGRRLGSLLTDGSTLCPDSSSGPCTTEPQWTPVGATATCCDPFKTAGCTRKAKGQTCTSTGPPPTGGDCECASLKCLQNKCE